MNIARIPSANIDATVRDLRDKENLSIQKTRNLRSNVRDFVPMRLGYWIVDDLVSGHKDRRA